MTVIFEPFQLDQHAFDRVAIVTDDNVHAIYGQLSPYTVVIPAGEISKTRAMKECIEDHLFKWGFSRNDGLVALGGGVISDLTGFVAATYCRGIPYINVPTTLMGMVDASIGGKCGVNTPHGKNSVGAFHMPEKVIIDTQFLKTLSAEEWKNGFAEVIKYALIADPSILDTENREELIRKCVKIKQDVIDADFKESGYRRILNFGHTVGHAIEHLAKCRIRHGEAVATGMAVEGALSGLDLAPILRKYGYNLECPFDPDEVIKIMGHDKKGVRGRPRFVLLKKIGQPMDFDGEYCTEIPDSKVKEALVESLACTTL